MDAHPNVRVGVASRGVVEGSAPTRGPGHVALHQPPAAHRPSQGRGGASSTLAPRWQCHRCRVSYRVSAEEVLGGSL